MTNPNDTPAGPRPQYGEYATPEQLARARGLTLEQLQEQITPPRPVAEPGAAAPAPAAAPTTRPADASAPARRRRPVDRPVTIGLLAFGLIYTLLNIPGFLALDETMQLTFDMLGYGEFRATDSVATLGVVAVVVQVAIWLAAASGSYALMKRGRAAWWVPLAGGFVTFIVVAVIVSVILLADPTFMESLSLTR